MILELMDRQPEASICYFKSDAKKAGGAYVTITGHGKKFDEISKTLILEDGTSIPVENILKIEFYLIQRVGVPFGTLPLILFYVYMACVLQKALLKIQQKFGKNTIFKANGLIQGLINCIALKRCQNTFSN